MALCMAGFIGVIVYGGWDGIQRGYTFGQFLVRFLIILFGVKAFDIIGLDYILIAKSGASLGMGAMFLAVAHVCSKDMK